ncbi:chorismate mutase [Vitreoscilla massiliensis]|uniref:chorismate mutase n=1 Tax=Vitreoscilla massiliensis TaxID=1689272 RepID=A0ABY4E3Z2_9NEIS|nr:chorismate mutase [Vitreoscilla massiliensis]UOO88137.1 chorismate mutase [Vitreoscilla massiliensis]
MQAQECQTLAQVRDEIDQLNSGILQLLAQRQHYVARAAELKTDVSAVLAPERRAAILQQVAQEAAALGMSSEVAVAVFTAMIDAFIAWETKQFKDLN